MITGKIFTGSPAVDVEISGIFPQQAKTVTAVIDTGFTGFAQIPFVQAFGMGLVLSAMAPFTLADGSTSHQLLCHAIIKLDGKPTHGLICLSQGDSVLLGMEWLRDTGLLLGVDASTGTVFLIPAEELTRTPQPAAPGQPVIVSPSPPIQAPESQDKSSDTQV